MKKWQSAQHMAERPLIRPKERPEATIALSQQPHGLPSHHVALWGLETALWSSCTSPRMPKGMPIVGSPATLFLDFSQRGSPERGKGSVIEGKEYTSERLSLS